MIKKICFRFEDRLEKFITSKVQSNKLLFKHITDHMEYSEQVEDVKKDFQEFFEENDKIWDNLILSIQLHSDLKEKLLNFNSNKILVVFKQFGKEITSIDFHFLQAI
ncbi:hypothetical protein IC216_14295 [Clostridioides sp. ES-S-0145-01]|uniref:hypothetical protein n=1 Tax=Clostridioides sp. ES-S-0145-01 TaxID=2770784 RepID=UPI001D12BA68|nr:hypothetical protein [Clostridioides sp. ES-S-0145-01]